MSEGWLNKPYWRYNYRQANKDEGMMIISVLQLNCELTRWVCLFPPGFSFMITEYCPRGSLQDILEDSDFELDTDFRLAIWN